MYKSAANSGFVEFKKGIWKTKIENYNRMGNKRKCRFDKSSWKSGLEYEKDAVIYKIGK